MSSRQSADLIRFADIEVHYADGRVVEYSPTPLDIWRLEDFAGKPSSFLANTFEGYSYLAFSCARRSGDAPRKVSSDKRAVFEQWLEGVDDVRVFVPDSVSSSSSEDVEVEEVELEDPSEDGGPTSLDESPSSGIEDDNLSTS